MSWIQFLTFSIMLEEDYISLKQSTEGIMGLINITDIEEIDTDIQGLRWKIRKNHCRLPSEIQNKKKFWLIFLLKKFDKKDTYK